jgi:DNA-binding XRE family transcriptional regulator
MSDDLIYSDVYPSKKCIPCKSPPKLITCHYCLNEWDCGRGCFVCPKCHTPFDPALSKSGFGGQILAARTRTGTSQEALAKIIGCDYMTINRIELGKSLSTNNPRGKMIRERLRIWVESTKSPIDKRKEIDDMFKESK